MSMLGLSDSSVYVFVLAFLIIFPSSSSIYMVSHEIIFFGQNLFSVSILHDALVCGCQYMLFSNWT